MQKQDKDNTYISETRLAGVFLIERPTFTDDRGFFREAARLNDLSAKIGFKFRPVQWNHSLSIPNVIRGLHAEAWNKLVYPVTGKMFAALADIRPDSSTFGQTITVEIDTSKSPKAIFISNGIANSICVLGYNPVNYLYLVDAEYDGKDIKAVAWDDPDLNIKWPLDNPIISERDRSNSTLRELFPQKF